MIIIRKFFVLVVLLLVFAVPSQNLRSQNTVDASEGVHEYTIFIFPTMHPLDWSSPSILYKSMLQLYLKTITLPDNYLIGHLAVRLESDLLDEPLYIGQASGRGNERIDMVLRQKVGYAILGATLPGRIEKPEEIKHRIDVYRDRNKLSFIKYRINKAAAQRILRYFELYTKPNEQGIAASDFYGGMFWPLHYNEGAGCSAFALAALELTGLMPEFHNDWRVDVKIPMELMGGEYNNGRKVKNWRIKRTHSWYEGSGKRNVDYAEYFVYEPALMFDWVKNAQQQPVEGFTPIEENGVQGLLYDGRNATFDAEAPIFVPRTDACLFTDKYFERRGIDPKTQPDSIK